MTRSRLALSGLLIAVVSAWYLSVQPSAGAGSASLPQQLSDKAFWALSTSLSEPNGYFRSDNLVSNEIWMQHVIPNLLKSNGPGRVYLGVGPEQNFTYIAALKPSMVFIVDVRRGNLQLHLMYKALFELSADRAEFVGRLFAKKRPEGLGPTSTVDEIFNAYADVQTSETLYQQNVEAIRNHLTKKRGLELSDDDLKGIEYVAYSFYWFGPGIHYSSSNGRGGRSMPTYYHLMIATDAETLFVIKRMNGVFDRSNVNTRDFRRWLAQKVADRTNIKLSSGQVLEITYSSGNPVGRLLQQHAQVKLRCMDRHFLFCQRQDGGVEQEDHPDVGAFALPGWQW